MDKQIWKSKTLWGFGLMGLIALAQVLGVPYTETGVAKIAEILTGLFGVYGLRSALD